MSAYAAYQNALSNFENQSNNYNEAKQSLANQLSAGNIAREATKDIAPLFIAESTLHGGKAYGPYIRSLLFDKPTAAAKDAINDAAKATRSRVGGAIRRGITRYGRPQRNLAEEDDAARSMTDPVQRVVDNPADVPEYLELPDDAPPNAAKGWFEGQRVFDQKIRNGDGSLPQRDSNDEIEQTYRDAGIDNPDFDDLVAHRAGQVARREQYQDLQERVANSQPEPIEDNPDGLDILGRAQAGDGPPITGEDAAPDDIGDVADARIGAADRNELVDAIGNRSAMIDRDLETEAIQPGSSEATMARAKLARLNRLRSMAKQEPEDPTDIAQDMLPARPAATEDTRALRMGRLNDISLQAQQEADRLEGQQQAFEQLAGRRVPEVDARIATNQGIINNAQTQMQDIANEPNPNDPLEQNYHNGIEDARIGYDRSGNIQDAEQQAAYRNGYQDMNEYQNMQDMHDQMSRANAAEKNPDAAASEQAIGNANKADAAAAETGEGASGGVEAGLDSAALAAEEAGPETEGAGFVVGAVLAVGSELAALFAPEKHDSAPPAPPIFAHFSGSQGLL